MVASLSDYTGLELKVIFVLPLQTLADVSAALKSKKNFWDHVKLATFYKYEIHWYFSHSCVFFVHGNEYE